MSNLTAVDDLLTVYDEAAWDNFSRCFAPEQSPVTCIGDDLWSAMKHLVSADDDVIRTWLQSKIPALGGHTPERVLALPEGQKVMRALVMRMPC